MRNVESKNLPLAGAVRHASRQLWLAGLGAAALTRDWAESGAGPMFRSLVKEGTLVEARTIRVVGDRLETSYTRVNSVWRRARAAVQSSVRDAADSAVSLVQKGLPRSLPQVKLPATPRWAFELTLPNGWVVRAADAPALAALLNVAGH